VLLQTNAVLDFASMLHILRFSTFDVTFLSTSILPSYITAVILLQSDFTCWVQNFVVILLLFNSYCTRDATY